jgi:hypothetical protein
MPSDAAIAPRRLTIRKVAPDRPWVWLNAGWRDLMANPRIGFFYGGALAAAGWLLILILLGVRSGWVILPASAGFFMVAPLLATGLYEASRLRAEGKPVTFKACLAGFTRNGQQLAFLGVLLVILHIFWVRVAALIFMLMFGINFTPSIENLPMAMLRSDMLLPFLIVGTGAGAILAAVAEGPAMPTLLLGDFNEWRAGAASALAVLEPRFGPFGPHRPSFPSRLPFLALDRILGQPHGLVRGPQVHDTVLARVASDHLPIRARIDLAAAALAPRAAA